MSQDRPVNNKGKQKGKTNNPNGRPKGTTNKLSAATLLDAIAQRDVPFEQGLSEDYVRARQENDRHLVLKYQQIILNKVVADKSHLDIDMNNERMIDDIFNRLTIKGPQDDQE